MKITRNDIIWNYAGSLLNLGISILVLPFVLRILNSDELGLWYVFGSISALVSLLDFGFSPSIMRNIIYAWSGAKSLSKEGIPQMDTNKKPNFELLSSLIKASKSIYFLITVLACIVLLLIGTPYIYKLVRFKDNYFMTSWGIYSIGVIINLYFSYWGPVLKGFGAIKEANQVQVFSKIIYLVFTIIGLNFGGGLIWLSFMYLISGLLVSIFSRVLFRFVSINCGFDKQESKNLDINKILITIWPNAKKQGLVTLGAWLITRSTTLICSNYFGLEVTAQYGLSLQLLSFVGGFSGLLFNSYIPEIASTKLNGDFTRYKTLFSRSLFIQWLVSIIGILSIIYFVPFGLSLIKSNSRLLPNPILLILSIVLFLEWNHSTFAGLITLSNKVPFVKSSLLSGFAITISSLCLAEYTNFGIFGLIIAQGIVQISYNNWYWPRYICIENKMKFSSILNLGALEFIGLIKRLLTKT